MDSPTRLVRKGDTSEFVYTCILRLVAGCLHRYTFAMKKPAHPAKAAHRRDAEATREAILVSARKAFARSGYDGAGLREIAAEAGVTAMMVNRYFGSKQRLFAEVIEQTMTQGSLIAGGIFDQPGSGQALAEALMKLTRAHDTPLDGFLITLHSASSQLAAEIGRDKISTHHLKTTAKALRGKHKAERAALILAMISGFQVMRQMIALPALANANEHDLADLLAGVFNQLIEPS